MNADPRRRGDRCVFGWSKTVHTIVGWDGVDWLVVWESGKRGILSRYWNPDAGDRILSRAPRPICGRLPRQLALFPIPAGRRRPRPTWLGGIPMASDSGC